MYRSTGKIGRMLSTGWNTVVPLFDAGKISVAPSLGPSRTRCLLRLRWLPRQDTGSRTSAKEDDMGGILPSNLMFVLAVVGSRLCMDGCTSGFFGSVQGRQAAGTAQECPRRVQSTD